MQSNPYSSSLYLVDCGREACVPGHQYGPAMRGYYLMHLVASGCGVFDNGFGRFEVHAGQGFMIFPDDISIYTADSDTPWDYVWVGFCGEHAAALTERAAISQHSPVFDFSRYARQILEIAYGVCDDVSLLLYHSTAGLGGLLRLMSYISQCSYDSSPQRSASAGTDSFQRALWYINANYQRADFHVEDVAAFVGLSRSQLFRVFKAQSGKSPQETLGSLRLSCAKRLLSGTRLTLTETALSSGFSSAARMGEVFKEHLGMTPLTYRKTAQSREDSPDKEPL